MEEHKLLFYFITMKKFLFITAFLLISFNSYAAQDYETYICNQSRLNTNSQRLYDAKLFVDKRNIGSFDIVLYGNYKNLIITVNGIDLKPYQIENKMIYCNNKAQAEVKSYYAPDLKMDAGILRIQDGEFVKEFPFSFN